MMIQKMEGFQVNIGTVMKDIFHPGTNYITEGTRGGGKTFHAISYAYGLVNGFWPEVGKVIMLTNVIFLKRVKKSKGSPKTDFIDTETPENVYHIDTMEGMFRRISELMHENPERDVLYLILLDEAQNFFNSYEAMSDVSREMQKWFGTLRKFDGCLWMMTPSIMNVPPKGRQFNDAPTPGYLNGIWSKNRNLIQAFLEAHGLHDNVNQWTVLKTSHDDSVKRFFKVPVCPWNRDYKKLEVGEFSYDQLASADFTMGSESFSFPAMVTRISNSSSLWMPDALAKFFDDMDIGAEGEENTARANMALDKFLMIKEMDKLGITYLDQARIFSTPDSTFRLVRKSLYNKFGNYCSEEELEQIASVQKKKFGRTSSYIKEKICDPRTVASKTRKSQKDTQEELSILLTREPPAEGEGAPDVTLETRVSDRNPLGSDPSPGVPDGIYDFNEFARAAEHCLDREHGDDMR